MQAIVQRSSGGPEVLRLESVEDPIPGDGQVRIAVEAAGVHFIDTKIHQGFSSGPLGAVALPMTPGTCRPTPRWRWSAPAGPRSGCSTTRG